MEKVIKTALASFGMSGQVFHGPTIKVNPHFSISKILERTKSLSEKDYPEATIVRSYEKIINDPEIELVIVNTPDPYHYEMTMKALEAGKHVVVEKPFTKTSEEAARLIQLARENNKILTVYQNRRLDSDFLTVKSLLGAGMLGRLVEFESHFDRYRNFVREGNWKETGDERTGVLFNLGAHMVDQALVLFGDPEAVTCHLAARRTGGEVPDYYDIRLHYDGFNAILKSSYLVREPGPRIILHGTEGSFLKWGIDQQEAMLTEGRLPDEPDWNEEPEEWWGTLHTNINGVEYKGKVRTIPGNFKVFYENLYEVIRHGKELLVQPEESKRVIDVLEACIESNRQRKTIDFNPS
ncbi:Gfo/Idh/MocA family oxidoreductase [Prolixibacter sp. NT017]|uniref:Gfo/Idh/MocA family oxidoreductase n=1 Tax=Prolixibacter sp. NT017 TaxID=2652390 RepID=UPI001280711A|nr:Gfo/Idh/MocA family oxidoreductase [Prolixibacter sp. NT017]GET26126.1 oxidoreductase [Prolixibacter sp. NT017]